MSRVFRDIEFLDHTGSFGGLSAHCGNCLSLLAGVLHFPQSSHLFSRAPNRVSEVRFNLIAQNAAATIIPLLRSVAILATSGRITAELDFPA